MNSSSGSGKQQKRPSQARVRQADSGGGSNKMRDASREEEEKILIEKLNQLKSVLRKSFKSEFIDSLSSLIRLENQSQAHFDACLNTQQQHQIDRVQHFLLQLKKIVKHKSQLMELINCMCLHRPVESTTLSVIYDQKRDDENRLTVQMDLVYEVNRFDSKDEYFQLVGILVRLLFKLFKHSIMIRWDKKLFDLELLLSSCLADLSFYEEIRSSLINDVNISCLFDIMTAKCDNRQEGGDTNGEMKQLWSKMFRLMANLSQERCSQRMKYFWSPHVIRCLARFMDKEMIVNNSPAAPMSNQLDIDFYHSLVRFIKYACELSKCKQLLLENRLLVNICKFMYRVNKSVWCLETDSLLDLNKLELSTSGSSAVCETTKTIKVAEPVSSMMMMNKERFVLSKKYETVFKDLIRHYFIVLDCWPQPFCIEFYNQIIEGKLVEHLLWLQQAECNNLTSTSTATSHKSSSSSTTSSFNYLEYSINFLYRLCYEYDACRAEFGRCGGLSHYISRIESQTNLILEKKSSTTTSAAVVPLFEFNRLIDIVCLACKESVNRLRLREQGLLCQLVRIQQRVKTNLSTLLGHYRLSASSQSIDSNWHNKILVGLCCFAHDQDSMSILLSNGLIDLLLAYLYESMSRENASSGCDTTIKNDHKDSEIINERPPEKLLLIKDLLKEERPSPLSDSISTPTSTSSLLRKRKLSVTSVETTTMINIPTNSKKLNTSMSSDSFYRLSSSSSPPPPVFPSSGGGSYSPKSPPPLNLIPTSPESSSCMSPTSFSMMPCCSSPPQRLTQSSPSFYLQRSPSTASSTDSTWPSPNPSLVTQTTNNVDFDMEYSNQIQFSPSIDHDDESDDDETRELADEEEEEIEAEAMLVECSSAKNTEQRGSNIDNKLSSLCSGGGGRAMSCSMSSLTSSLSSTNMMNIESINQTEACVFYVLSQLSHGEKPSLHLMQQFDSVLNCLLDYLRQVGRVRNPRALRILNRLTKNQHCFQSFILCYFPYKLKEKLEKDVDTTTTMERGRRREESQIDQEMNLYLNNNKVFFDTTSASFPSFQSIQHYLLNNLKSQCILANNHGYVTLVNMIKSSSRMGATTTTTTNSTVDEHRVASTLSSPFILRNSKALYYIMIHLNGVDLLLDNILTTDNNQDQRINSIICMQRVLLFVNFKRDLKQLNEYCGEKRRCVIDLQRATTTTTNTSNDDEIVNFVFDDDQDLSANRVLLSSKSDYFNNLLVNERFGPLSKQIPITNVKYDVMLIILSLLECCVTITSEELMASRRIGFATAVDLVLACDQYFLIDMRDFFIAIIALEFLTMWTACTCFKLAWYVNSELLANAVIDLVLASFKEISMSSEETSTSSKTEQDKTSRFVRSFDHLLTDLRQQTVSISPLAGVFCLNVQNEQLIVDSFRQRIKSALGEIIKNGTWKL